MKQATDRRKDGDEKFAVKIINKTALSQEDEQALDTEVLILEKMQHTNVVRLREVYDCPVRPIAIVVSPASGLCVIPCVCWDMTNPPTAMQTKFYMVMELCTGGELFDRIVKKAVYTEDEARKCVLQV